MQRDEFSCLIILSEDKWKLIIPCVQNSWMSGISRQYYVWGDLHRDHSLPRTEMFFELLLPYDHEKHHTIYCRFRARFRQLSLSQPCILCADCPSVHHEPCVHGPYRNKETSRHTKYQQKPQPSPFLHFVLRMKSTLQYVKSLQLWQREGVLGWWSLTSEIPQNTLGCTKSSQSSGSARNARSLLLSIPGLFCITV